MIFELNIQQPPDATHGTSIRVNAADWFTALREGLTRLDKPAISHELNVTFLDDDHSVVIEEPSLDRKMTVLAIKQEAPKAPQNKFEALTHVRFETSEIPVMPTMTSESFSLCGAYTPGATTDFLAEAFMKVGDLYGNFGEDFDGAMTHLFQMLQKATKAAGGGLLLTDINVTNESMQFAHAFGPLTESLKSIHFTASSGILGHCIQTQQKTTCDDLQTETNFGDEPLIALNIPAGPVLCIPIAYQQRQIGAVVLYRKQGTQAFTEGEANIFTYLSISMADYLHQIGKIA